MVEENGRFFCGKAQICGAQFGELATNPQARQRQGRVFTGGDDEVKLWRQMVEQEGEGVIYWWGVEPVVVVEDEDEGVGNGRRLVEQHG